MTCIGMRQSTISGIYWDEIKYVYDIYWDQIKYVYDFGDWIEHSITLETIQATETDTQYPRIASQNKPRYRYCQDCKGRGDRTVADYVCIDCSNQAQQVVLVCIDCLQENHEDHYGDEVIY